jgi:hypothetical protein
MPGPLSTFLDFNLPNATTWFYFSFLLAVALFFKFSRLLSVRNLDVVMIFLLVPGLLLVQTTRPQPMPIEKLPAVHVASLVGHGALPQMPAALAAESAVLTNQCGPVLEKAGWLWYGYLWLLVGSVYFFCRCLLDLTLVQRPALAPNLQMGGMAWFAGALLICMVAVAYRQAERHINPAPIGNGAAPSALLLLHPPEQPVFAVAILWRDWPAWGVAALAFAGHVTVIAGLVLISWRHFQDLAAGMAAATFYLLLPYTGLSVGQLHHVLPMALFLGTLLSYRSPTLTGCLLGIATGATYFPLFTLPIWVSFYRGRGTGRFMIAFLLALAGCVAIVSLTLWANDELEGSLQLARESGAWQPWKDLRTDSFKTEGFWTGVHWAYRIPVFLLFISFVLTTSFWPSPKNLAHVIALSAAMVIGLQWWCADQGGMYVLWYMPLLLLMIFRPNLQDRVAVPIRAETDWLARSRSWIARTLRRLFRLREPVKTTAG